MAYARIGYTYGVTWGLPERAKPYLQKAFTLSHRLTPRDRLNITAWYAVASGDYTHAIQLYRQIVAAYPHDSEAHLRLGRLLQGEEQFEEAVAVLLRAVAADPHRPELYNQLAGIHNDWKKPERALEYARRYVELSGGEANAHDTLGLTYLALGDYAKARAEFERALVVRPDFEVARVHLANTFVREGKYAAADDHFHRYITMAPSAGERLRGWSSRAWIARQRGRLDEAQRYLREIPEDSYLGVAERIQLALLRGDIVAARKLQPHAHADAANRGGRVTSRFRLHVDGSIALKSGRTQEALQLFARLLSHSAPMWSVDDLETAFADALLEAGRHEAAIAEYARVAKQWPAFGPARFGLAEAYFRSNRYAEALGAYRTFLTVWRDADADLPIVRAAERRVQELAAAAAAARR